MFRPLMLIAPLVLATGLAACDGEDYEARVVELEGQLESARGETEQLRTQLEESQARITEFEQQGQAAGGGNPDALREPIQTALAALAESDERLDRLAGSMQGQAEVDPQAVEEARQGIRRAAEAIGNAAESAGIQIENVAPQAQPQQPQTQQ